MGFASLFLLVDIISGFKFVEQPFVLLRMVLANCLCPRDVLSLQINIHKWNKKMNLYEPVHSSV